MIGAFVVNSVWACGLCRNCCVVENTPQHLGQLYLLAGDEYLYRGSDVALGHPHSLFSLEGAPIFVLGARWRWSCGVCCEAACPFVQGTASFVVLPPLYGMLMCRGKGSAVSLPETLR